MKRTPATRPAAVTRRKAALAYILAQRCKCWQLAPISLSPQSILTLNSTH